MAGPAEGGGAMDGPMGCACIEGGGIPKELIPPPLMADDALTPGIPAAEDTVDPPVGPCRGELPVATSA